MGRFRLRLALAVSIKLEALLDWHTKHDRNLECSLKGRRILVLLDGNDGLARDAHSIGKFLLCHFPRGSKFPNPITYRGHQRAFR